MVVKISQAVPSKFAKIPYHLHQSICRATIHHIALFSALYHHSIVKSEVHKSQSVLFVNDNELLPSK